MRVTAAAFSLLLCSCATVDNSGFGGFGGTTVGKDSFTGVKEISTGFGFVFCPKDQALLCNSGFGLSFKWRESIPDKIFFVVEHLTIENIDGLEFNVDGKLLSFEPIDPMTEFASPGSTGGTKAYQRFFVPIEDAKRIMAASQVLVRVMYLNNKTSQTGDFNRPTSFGQPSARELLANVLSKIS